MVTKWKTPGNNNWRNRKRVQVPHLEGYVYQRQVQRLLGRMPTGTREALDEERGYADRKWTQ